jgi:hypothetical protein
VGGQPLVIGILTTLAGLGCEGREFGPPLSVHSCTTPSSFHTLVMGLEAVAPGPVFCTMVDTVMPPADWRGVYAAIDRGLAAGDDAMLAVTPFVDDESPLYVSTDDVGSVRILSDDPLAPPRVTGGVYGFSPGVRQRAAEAVGMGVQRMRGFLKWLVARGARVGTITVPRIIDIDHESDLRLANAWLSGQEARA